MLKTIEMNRKINKTLEYYYTKRKEISDFVNFHNNLTPDQIIYYGEEMAILEYKITALEIAKEN
jgi:hypothetical protein